MELTAGSTVFIAVIGAIAELANAAVSRREPEPEAPLMDTFARLRKQFLALGVEYAELRFRIPHGADAVQVEQVVFHDRTVGATVAAGFVAAAVRLIGATRPTWKEPGFGCCRDGFEGYVRLDVDEDEVEIDANARFIEIHPAHCTARRASTGEVLERA